MGNVSCFTLKGCNVFFNSMDHHPPHIHVQHVQSGWQIRVFIETTTLEILDYTFKYPRNGNVRISGKLQQGLREKIVSHREKLLKEWNNKVVEV